MRVLKNDRWLVLLSCGAASDDKCGQTELNFSVFHWEGLLNFSKTSNLSFICFEVMVCSLWFSKVNLLSFADQFEDNIIIPSVVLPWWLDASVSNHVLSISVFWEGEDMLTDSEGLACPLKAIGFSVHVGFFPYVQRPLIFKTLCSYVIICLFTLLFHCTVWFWKKFIISADLWNDDVSIGAVVIVTFFFIWMHSPFQPSAVLYLIPSTMVNSVTSKSWAV